MISLYSIEGFFMPSAKHPVISVGAVVVQNNAVLLVKRKNPPCQNEWAIPGGKVKLGETLQQAAEREILEETGLKIKAHQVVYGFDLIKKDAEDNILYHYVIVDLAADYLSGVLKAKDDALDAQWFTNECCKDININKTTRLLLQEKFGYIF